MNKHNEFDNITGKRRLPLKVLYHRRMDKFVLVNIEKSMFFKTLT